MVKDKENISDGFHTFKELYEHRSMLFGIVCFFIGGWKSKKHYDNTMEDGWFIAGCELNGKTITYHLPTDLFDIFPTKEIEKAPKWDGHTSNDVIKCMKSYWTSLSKLD